MPAHDAIHSDLPSERVAAHRTTSPRALPRLGTLARFANRIRTFIDPLTASQRVLRAHGDLVAVDDRVICTDAPAIAKEVLLDHRTFTKDFSQVYDVLSTSFWGSGFAVSNQDAWLRKRRVVQAALSADHLRAYADVVTAGASRLLDTWRSGETRDVQADLMRLTLENTARVCAGSDLDAALPQIEAAVVAAMRWFENVELHAIGAETREEVGFKEAVARMNEQLAGVIQRRRSAPEPRKDVLSAMMSTPCEDGSLMTDDELRDELVTMFRAGHRNTATTLAWAIGLLAAHPRAQEELAGELARVLGGRAPALTDVPRLSYATRVVQETMRCYPLYPFILREARQGGTLAGRRIPASSKVIISIWSMHRDGRTFDRPDAFEPDRWAAPLDDAREIYAFLPFGGGPRRCPFKSYAMVEAVLLLASLAQRFRFRLAPGHRLRPMNTANGLMPRDGMKIVLEAR
ncbi:Cytochrome P450 [Minicystis rosea]|nr:Cytochrome P450 [Minicystis rosea]